MARVLLLMPTGTSRAPDFVEAARALGVDVVIGTDEEQTMAAALGDRAVTVDLARPEAAADAVVDLHRRNPLDAVVAVDDQGVVVAALAGERLGLRHNPPHAVRAARDKARLRRLLAAAGVPQPRFAVAEAGDDVAAIARQVGLPCVVKPLTLSASRGVIRADTEDAAVAAAERVRGILDCAGQESGQSILVESFVRGAEVAVEALLRDGRLDVLAVFDKPDPLDGPYFEETLYVTPSRHPAAVQEAVAALVASAAEAIGLREGPVHAEARVPPEGPPVLLEIAARSIGGLCARTLRFGTGMSLEELILRHAVGLPVSDLHREAVAAGLLMRPIPAAGRLDG